ncbi:prepilin-type N-terminal cleavage/methylation domain-containing protein [Persephonella sp. IF05-L8]|uniref:prepilin-type N-terminal cleavage/methylation domain-containing protein n=1 Tax=Persephonella sp. IF05-L8 TaxID=1158338 RepID=UPI0030B9B4D9
MENKVMLAQEELEQKRKKEGGFTLIELLIVIAIIAILAAIALPQFNKYKQSAYKDAVRSDVRNAVSSIEAFVADYGKYPTSTTSCGAGPTQCDLSDGTNTMKNAINVSRDVTLTFTWDEDCGDGTKGYKVEGEHAQLGTTWKASYNSCTGKYTNF